MRVNPILIERARGLIASGTPHAAVIGALALPAVALLLWWPKSDLIDVLQSADAPDTLLAVLIALGASTAWHALRAGAEETLLPEQHGLREWAIATDVPLGRIVLGSILGHLLELVQLLLFAAPLVLMAFAVSGGEWPALAACVLAIVLQAVFYRLLAALVYLRIGQHATATFICVRALLPAGYLAAALLLPSASHLALSAQLMDGGFSFRISDARPELAVFVIIYVIACALAALGIHRALRAARTG